MASYLLKSTACLLVFYLFYHFLLELQTNHSFKRYYLLASLVAGLSIPVIPLVDTATLLPATIVNWAGDAGGGGDISKTSVWETTMPAVGLWAYILGLSLFGYIFLRNLFRLWRKTQSNPKLSGPDHTKVLLSRKEPPHTFFRYLFLFGPAYRQGEIPDGVLAHEAAHIRQKHSLDLLFLELACLVCWFHPVFWLYRRAVRLNHEFLADREVLCGGYSAKDYQHLLLASTQTSNQPAFTHAFHYSSIKKRIQVMKNSTSVSRQWLTCLILLPLSALMFYSFSDRKTEYLPVGEVLEVLPPEAYPDTRDDISAIILEETAQPDESARAQKGATREEMKEYERLARKYNEMLESESVRIIGDEVARMKVIYARMSDKQRADTEPFPDFPPPPPAPDPQPAPLPESVSSTQPAQPVQPPRPVQPAHPSRLRATSQPDVREVPPPPPAPGATELRPGTTPPPPPPPDPEKHLRELASQGADFYYRGNPIRSKEALELFEAGKVDRINVRNSDGGTPQVYLAD